MTYLTCNDTVKGDMANVESLSKRLVTTIPVFLMTTVLFALTATLTKAVWIADCARAWEKLNVI